MSENQRYKDMVSYLKEKKIIRNQQDFVERIGSDKSTVSQIINGKISIPNNMFVSIEKAFPFISMDWLKMNEGEMTFPQIVQNNQTGDNINGKSVTVNKTETDKLLDALNACHELLRKKDEQIDRLLTLLEKSNN